MATLFSVHTFQARKKEQYSVCLWLVPSDTMHFTLIRKAKRTQSCSRFVTLPSATMQQVSRIYLSL
jgi:hypothetical protein